MKTGRPAFRMRREQRLVGFEKDPYKATRKPRGTTLCGDCGALFQRGRWTWLAAPANAQAGLCPACRRIRERAPAAFLTLGGVFAQEHRTELLSAVRKCEKAERKTHPMQRIMAVKESGERLLVTTTDPHLARRIGDALFHAYKGKLRYRYAENEALLRVTWIR